ncbi:MAG: cadherin-like beta sandwich domain-containing protein [Ilumatobacteraceae bacterium]
MVQKLRRTAVMLSATVLVGGLLLAAPKSAQALSSADLITSLAYTTPTSQFALRNEADDKAATFVPGDGNDDAALTSPFFNDIYTIRLYHSAISLIPTVSAKATWSCGVSGDGTGVDEDCSVSGLTGGDEATIVITVEAENGDTNDYTFYVDAYSTDATLSALTTDVGTLTPVFNSAVVAYTVTTGQDAFDLDPTANDGGATVVCKKGSLTLTNCAGALAVGANSIVITVTAADGTTKKTYTVAITRVADTNNQIHKLTLSNGGLLSSSSGAGTFTRASFLATTLAYDLTTNQDTLDITVDLKNEDGTFNCTVAGDVALVDAGDATGNSSGDTCELALTGATEYTGNTLTVVVDPEGVGGTNQSYVFTITIDEDTVGNAAPDLTPVGTSVRVGKPLSLPAATAANGLFDNETRVLYQWYVCDTDVAESFTDLAVPTDCSPKGTGARTYIPTTADVGKHVIGALIGHPGSALSFSDSVEVVGYPGLAVAKNIPAPEETSLVGAEIGVPINLENISLSDFTGITDVATEVDFQWYRCTSAATTATQGASLTTPSGCTKISGEDGDSYTPAEDSEVASKNDSGKFLRVRLILNPPGNVDHMIYTRTTNRVFGPPVATSSPGAPSAPSLTVAAPTKVVTASNGAWSGNPTLVTTDPDNYSYQWYACSRPVSSGGNTDPTTLLDRDGNPKCEEIGGEILKTVTIGAEWCGYYLLVGVTADNTDFRGKGGTSAMRYSPTSTNPVGGTACTY